MKKKSIVPMILLHVYSLRFYVWIVFVIRCTMNLCCTIMWTQIYPVLVVKSFIPTYSRMWNASASAYYYSLCCDAQNNRLFDTALLRIHNIGFVWQKRKLIRITLTSGALKMFCVPSFYWWHHFDTYTFYNVLTLKVHFHVSFFISLYANDQVFIIKMA